MSDADELARNRATVAGYDACAVSYAAETDHDPTPDHLEALERFSASVGPGGRVLEVASGPGWDADRLEAMGLDVRRTDLSEGFIAFQRERGRIVEQLDLIAGDLEGPWDGLVDGVLARIEQALRPGGALLLSYQEGDGERTSVEPEGAYQIVRWRERDMSDALLRHGLSVE